MSRLRLMGVLLAGLVLAVAAGGVAFAAQGDTTRVSVREGGFGVNGDSESAAISADGRYVAFHSDASNLVSDDTNGTFDVFVHDRQTGTTTRVSVDSNGNQGNNHSFSPSISADGRHVAFNSNASNLVSGDTNGTFDVFVHDRQTGTTTRVSVDSNGIQGNADSSGRPAISADGRYVAFHSSASNLVSDDTNGSRDVFVHDRQTGTTTRVSVGNNGIQANSDSSFPAISADGRYVAFYSEASNLVSDDSNGTWDVFVHDRQTGNTTRVSVASNGIQGNADSSRPAISADGRHVAFHSDASNLVSDDTNGTFDVFVHDRQTGTTTRVTVDSNGNQGNNHSFAPAISADGRHVAFNSNASNLVSDDTNGTFDVFVHDRQTGTTTRVSVDSNGIQGNDHSVNPAISADGRHVPFQSEASNLVSNDTNGLRDVFVHQYLPDPPPPPPPPPDPVTFVDTVGHLFEGDISAIAAAGITKGCNPPVNDRFCPDDEVTRGQMAAFLTRALDLTAPAVNPFVDTTGNTFQRDIQALAAAGITKGCNPPVNDRFCPDDNVTRGQMAAFLTRALDLTAPAENPFVDTTGNTFQRDIQALAAAGITRGCNPPANDRFCPDDHVTRGQMAAFLNRGLLK